MHFFLLAFLGKLKCVAQAQTTRRLTRSNAVVKSSSLIFCFCLPVRSFHFHRYFPHCALSSSVTTIRGVPLHAILLLPLCHFWRSQSFPPTNQRWHERNRSLTCNILRYQEKHGRTRLLRPFHTLLHLLQKLHDFSSCFLCQVQGTFGWNPLHPTPVFALYNFDAFSRSPSFNLGNASSHSSMACLAYSVFPRHIDNALPILCSSPHNDLTKSYLLPSSGSVCTLNHLPHLSLMHLLHLFFLIFLLHVLQPFVPFMHGISPSCVGPCLLTILREQLRDPPTVLAFQIFHDGHPLLLLRLLLFCQLFLLALQTVQIVFPKQRENYRPAVFSPLSNFISLVFAYSSPFQRCYLCL